MLIFISGSINSGKTTTSKRLSERINAVNINVDDLNDRIENFSLASDLDKSMDLAISEINNHTADGKDVVANYVLRPVDYARFFTEIKTRLKIIITLAPKIEIAQGKRGDRNLSEWEKARVKYHYDSGIASPTFGYIIDNSEMSIDQTVDRILDIVDSYITKQT